jgi:hypothetical protein
MPGAVHACCFLHRYYRRVSKQQWLQPIPYTSEGVRFSKFPVKYIIPYYSIISEIPLECNNGICGNLIIYPSNPTNRLWIFTLSL